MISKDYNNVMLDLETWGTTPGCAIASIGAVIFDDQEITSTFYQRVELSSCVDAGLAVDAETLRWWFEQSNEVRQEAFAAGMPLSRALLKLNEFILGRKHVEPVVWGNGAGFDNVILEACYKACGLPTPWKFYNNRCYRTVKNLLPSIKLERQGTHHNALHDAISQAEHLIRMHKECVEQQADFNQSLLLLNQASKLTLDPLNLLSEREELCDEVTRLNLKYGVRSSQTEDPNQEKLNLG